MRERPGGGPGWLTVFAVTLGLLALLWQPGFYINDEYTQAAGLYALYDGHLLIESDLPQGYRDLERGAAGHGGLPKPGGDARVPVGSTMLNALALPVRHGLGESADAVGVMPALGATAAALVAVGAWAALRQWRPEMDAWTRRNHSVAAGAVLLAGAILHPRDLPASPFLEIASIQLVTMVTAAFSAALMHDLLRRHMAPSTALMLAALYLFGTPALFWSLNIKYHGLTMALVVMAVWCYRDGHRTPPLRTAAAFGAAGIAVWNHAPNGGLLVGSMGLVALPAVLLGLKPLAQRAAAGAGGLAVGLVPETLSRWRNASEGRGERYVNIQPTPDAQPPPGQKVQETVEREVEAGRLSQTVLDDPGGVWEAFVESVFWTDWWTSGVALSVLSAAPFVVLGVWTLVRRDWRRRLPAPLVAWPLVFGAAMYGLMGHRLLVIGAGYDIRYISAWWPFLVLLAAPALAGVAERWRAAAVAKAVGLAVLVLAVVHMVPTLLVHHVSGWYVNKGYSFEAVAFSRYAGLAAAIALALFWASRPAWRRRGPLDDWRLGRDALVALAVALGLYFQAVLVLGPGKSPSPTYAGPFVAWPTDLVARFVEWMLFSVA